MTTVRLDEADELLLDAGVVISGDPDDLNAVGQALGGRRPRVHRWP